MKQGKFICLVNFYKNKVADAIFKTGNFNNDLLKYAVSKISSEARKQHNTNKTIEAYKTVSKETEGISTQFSCLLLFILLMFSFLLIWIHSYLYSKRHRLF